MSKSLASLQRRLVWRLMPAVAVTITLGGITSYVVAKRSADYAYDQALAAAAVDIANGIHDGASPGFDLSPQSERILRSDERDDIFFSVRADDGVVIGGDRDLDATDPVDAASAISKDVIFRNRTLRAITIRVGRPGNFYLVTVGETTRKRQAAALAIFTQLMVPTALVLILACAIVWASVRAGLNPLAGLQAELEARSEHDLSPIDEAQAPSELRSFVHALNRLLGRLQTVNRLHQSFVADAAHQLRTPLAGIQSQIEMLATKLPPAEGTSIDRLRFSVERAVRLGNQLLSLARSEMDANVMRSRPVDPTVLIGDSADAWVHRGIERDIDVGFRLEPSPLIGDPHLLQELLENLVDNALRHTPPGGHITVSSMRVGPVVELTVEDSGPGVPDAAKERIFERFFRLSEGNDTGSGLGLAIVRQIAMRHEGTAEVIESETLGGVKVVVRLPASGPPRKARPGGAVLTAMSAVRKDGY